VHLAPALLAGLAGLATGFGLIVAIGAQNSYVLRLGIAGPARAIAAVVAICALSDLALITAGVAGVGALIAGVPVLLVVLRFVGAAFLIGYGLLAARRAVRPGALRVDDAGGPDASGAPVRWAAVLLPALAFTWLNPHVYLDTLVLLGSIANQQGAALRWWWAVGAGLASILWFAALGFGARLLRPVFARPAAWRVLDIAIAAIMIGLGLKLAIWG
jgi:L-lysine exporter family protein LysE/ArgO